MAIHSLVFVLAKGAREPGWVPDNEEGRHTNLTVTGDTCGRLLSPPALRAISCVTEREGGRSPEVKPQRRQRGAFLERCEEILAAEANAASPRLFETISGGRSRYKGFDGQRRGLPLKDSNPYNGEAVAKIALGNLSDVEEGYMSASKAQPSWAARRWRIRK